MKYAKNKQGINVLLIAFFFLFIFAFSGNAAPIDDQMAQCAQLQDNAERLKCFDELAARQSSVNDAVADTAPGNRDVLAMPADEADSETPTPEKPFLSVMEKYWDMSLERNRERNIFALWPYRPNFFMPAAYNSSPNQDTDLDFDPDAKSKKNEVKFQISFKFKIWKDIFTGALQDTIEDSIGIRGVDVWIAYTQQSFWQLYNKAFSAPFRDTNYEPELLFNFRIQQPIPFLIGTKLQFINVGFNHQSNGRSEPLSRSWNRIVASAGFEKNNFGLLLRAWSRIPEKESNDDNPDLIKYTGYGELLGTFYWERHRFALMLRNNLRHNNKGAVQLDWSFPLPFGGDKISGYIQFFNGYGEGLLDYNKNTNRISAGFMLADWN
ncbi:MAG: phospholipase A [Smithella sp.]|nr:phospholipase A [Smithella sp.]